MDPITGAVEGKVAGGLFDALMRRLRPDAELRKELEREKRENVELRAQLNREREFDARKVELVCRHEDDCMYQLKDGTGPYYCPTCLEVDEKFVSLPRFGTNEDNYYCIVHKHTFSTRERREKRNRPAPPIRFEGTGPHGWMR